LKVTPKKSTRGCWERERESYAHMLGWGVNA
jgi:hypothetical protein